MASTIFALAVVVFGAVVWLGPETRRHFRDWRRTADRRARIRDTYVVGRWSR